MPKVKITPREVKKRNYDEFMQPAESKKQTDIVFQTIAQNPNITDRELHQKLMDKDYFMPIGQIPARRKNINENKDEYERWKIEPVSRRKCHVTGKKKLSWHAVHDEDNQVSLFS